MTVSGSAEPGQPQNLRQTTENARHRRGIRQCAVACVCRLPADRRMVRQYIRPVTLPSSDPSRAAVSRVSRRLIPFLLLLYILNFLDRVNVGFTAVEMTIELGLRTSIYDASSGFYYP